MNFVAFDFETANEKQISVCQIGIAVVEEGKITKKKAWLIKPPELRFNPFNTIIHGITQEDVEEEPEFNVIWKKIKRYFEGKTVIAHNASFDLVVLRSILDHYEISYPELEFFCSIMIAKKTWPDLPKYGLKSLASHLEIDFKHHDAAEDAYACAEITRQACLSNGTTAMEELAKKLELSGGHLSKSGYLPTRQRNPFNLKEADPKKLDPNHPFFNQTFVFTGTLKSMKRQIAMQKVADVGGHCLESVDQFTNFLVLGEYNFKRFSEGFKSAKLKKAEKLISKGHTIEYLGEKDFMEILGTENIKLKTENIK